MKASDYIRLVGKSNCRYWGSVIVAGHYLIGSGSVSDEVSTFGYLHSAEKLIRSYVNQDCIIKLAEEPVDFSDYEQVFSILLKAVHACRYLYFPDDSIIIDCTPGKKIVSIAAASITMSNNITFQYIDATPHSSEFEIFAYNLSMHSSLDI